MGHEIRTDPSPEAMVRAIENHILDYSSGSDAVWIAETDDIGTLRSSDMGQPVTRLGFQECCRVPQTSLPSASG